MDKEEIESELNCSICLETYTDPRILQCSHVFCRKCLTKLVMRDQQGELSLSCPVCRQVTPAPANGTAGLQTAFHIKRLLEILDKAKGEAASAERVDRKIKDLSPASCCSEHDGKELELFCEMCEELICYKCVAKSGKHHGHSYREISEIDELFERYKKEITQVLEPLEKKKTALAEKLTQLDRHCEKTSHQRAVTEGKIRESSKQLHDIISKRQNHLISQLDQITTSLLESLLTQRNQIETLQAQLSGFVDLMRKNVKLSIQQHEVLALKTDIHKQEQQFNIPFQISTSAIDTEARAMFLFSEDAAAVCKSYGRVLKLESPDPSKCIATGQGTTEAVVGKTSIAALQLFTRGGEQCNETSALSLLFEVEVVSEITGSMVFGSVEESMEKIGQGQYVISYVPSVRGRHQLHIKVGRQHIKGSPFRINVTQPGEERCFPIQVLHNLVNPRGVAVNGRGEVVVAEWDAHCVSVLSPRGVKTLSIGTPGSGTGQLLQPSDVTVDDKGNILVLEQGNHRIQKFTANGNFLTVVGTKGFGPLQFNSPAGITYSSSNDKVYVVDTDTHRIQVLNPDLTFNCMFGRRGSGRGQFLHPRGITTDTSGRVYVADSCNHRIQVFTAEGKFLKMFGKKGTDRGKMQVPWGIGFDAGGLLYVSENWNHRVSVFTSEGGFVAAFSSKGIDSPCGLVFVISFFVALLLLLLVVVPLLVLLLLLGH